MICFIKLSSIAVVLFLSSVNGGGDASIREPKERNLAARVKICFNGEAKLIYRKRLTYFLELGATLGSCPALCSADVKRCQGGSYVGRNPNRNCRFYPCPVPDPPCCDPSLQPGTNGIPLCVEGSACCPDGTWVCSMGDAKSFVCAGQIITSGFGQVCSEPVVCPDIAKLCPDGSYVTADPKRNCEFDPCPRHCCDPGVEPGTNGVPMCVEGSACCPDGSWVCSIGDGKTFVCDGKTTTTDFGQKCTD